MNVAKRTVVRKERSDAGNSSSALAAHQDESRKRTPAPADLLAWYDKNRRVLPWRALPGERPDPYRVWLSEIMLQQTTVVAVVP
jgi:A/G-specific adenine glycosylase